MKRLIFSAIAVGILATGFTATATAADWGHRRYHDDLDHRAYHRHLAHRSAHRYPMTWRQHGRLHDNLEHDAFHDRLEHRAYHRAYSPYVRRSGFYGYGPIYGHRSGFGIRSGGFSLWIGR